VTAGSNACGELSSMKQEEFFEQEFDNPIGEKLESNLTNLVTRETKYGYHDEDIREKNSTNN